METKQHATNKTNGSMRKSRRKLKNTLKQMTMKTQPLKTMGCCESSAHREIYSNTGLPQKTRKISSQQQTKPKVSRRKEIMKFREEVNKTE